MAIINGHHILSAVKVEYVPKELQAKTVTPTTSQQVITADSSSYELSQVTVNAVTSAIDANIQAENIAEGITILGVTGTFEGGSASPNIEFSTTAPTDTTKLWVNTSTALTKFKCSSSVPTETIETLSTTLPRSARYIASGVVGTKVYLFGGQSGGTLDTINVFDTESETITTLSTTLPSSARNITSGVVGTKVYLFGGLSESGALDTINIFDTETNTITTLSTTLPTATFSIASGVVGTKVYLFGGGSVIDTINVFDTETNTITTLSTALPIASNAIASGVVGTKVYLFGGYGGGTLDTINVFDTETNTITTLSTTLPSSARDIASGVVGTKVYLFGGYYISSGAVVLNTINVFDTESETITTLSITLPTAAYGIASGVIGTKVYLFGGYGGGSVIDTINKFNTYADTLTLLISSTSYIDFELYDNFEVNLSSVYIGASEAEAYYYDINTSQWVQL